jgi:single-strand selective monofunctional uracil DNA glycosylase
MRRATSDRTSSCPARAAEIAAEVVAASRSLARSMARLHFDAPVTHVYNPLSYARRAHEAYIGRYGAGRKRVVFLGMNPGPFGMAQTGVPFGAVQPVRRWLALEGPVSRPRRQQPKRPVLGYEGPPNEVRGERLWGAIEAHFGTPERFFAQQFIANYCPLLFLEQSGRNRTPDKLPSREQQPLFAACDRHLQRLVDALEPDWVVGVGRFATERASAALDGRGVRLGRILHPSPANPRAQRDWRGIATHELAEQGVCGKRRGK